MANETELNELRERIGRLSSGEQVWLLESILADNRRKYEETLAWMAASQAAYLEAEKRVREATEPVPFPSEVQREAGEIYVVDLGVGAGREVSGVCPVVIVSNDVSNTNPILVIVVPAVDASDVRAAIGIRVPSAESGYAVDLAVIARHPRTLDPSRFPDQPSGVIPPAFMEKINLVLKGELSL